VTEIHEFIAVEYAAARPTLSISAPLDARELGIAETNLVDCPALGVFRQMRP
jgi:hypothetical protein